MNEKPGMVQAIAIMSIVSGAVNVLAGFWITGLVIVGSLGIGIVCAPLTILPSVLGVFEIIYGVKLASNPPKPVNFSFPLAILEILMIGTFFVGNLLAFVPLIIGILALVFYNNEEVNDYFNKLNA